jgi:hypothetical protein
VTREVTIRGVTYPSQRHAAEALGVAPQTVAHAVKRGTADNVGLGPLQKGCKPPRLCAITIGGVAYTLEDAIEAWQEETENCTLIGALDGPVEILAWYP